MDHYLEEIKKILSTPIALRTPKMMNLLIMLTKDIKFFKDLISDLGQKMHYRICEFLNIEFCESNKVFFN